MTKIQREVKREIEREREIYINPRNFEADDQELSENEEYRELKQISQELRMRI